MKLSFSDIKSQYLANIGQTGSTDTNLLSQFKTNLGQRYQMIMAEMRNYQTTQTKNTSTVVGQQYYHYPVGMVMGDNAYITIANVKYPLSPIYSQTQWNLINAIQIQPSAFPQFIFYRRDDFGIWPIPQGVYAVSFNLFIRDRNLQYDDYTTNTITATNGSTSIVGSSTTFTSAMVGRWLQITSDVYGQGYWYRISGFTSTTVITLENAYEGDTVIGASYRICECPEIPDEGHIILVDGVTADFYAGPRSDIEKGTWFNNKFWTGDGNNSNRDKGSDKNAGGLLALASRYSGRDDKRVVIERPSAYPPAYKIFSTTISSS